MNENNLNIKTPCELCGRKRKLEEKMICVSCIDEGVDISDSVIVNSAKIDGIINFVNLLSSDIERSASETIVEMLEKLKGN